MGIPLSKIWGQAVCVGWLLVGPGLSARGAVEGMLDPRLSPDGEWVAVSYQGAIGKVRRTGGPLVMLSRGESWDVEPGWSPDGRRIAYVATTMASGSTGQLRLLDAETGAEIPLVRPVQTQGRGPVSFHPDGSRLLARLGSPASGRLAWVELETGEVRLLSFGEPDARLTRQHLSPHALSDDGRSIFFAVHPDEPGEQTGSNGPEADVFQAPAGGGAAKRILRFTARIYGLSGDGTGRGIYAVSDAGASHNDVWHLPLAAPERGARKLTASQADDDSPSADARGRWLVHTENSGGTTSLLRRNSESGITDAIQVERIDYGGPAERVRLSFQDENGAPVVARVSVRRRGGKFHAPPNALYRITGGLAHFYARSEAGLELPPGHYEMRVFRGPEYRMHEREFEVRPGTSPAIAVRLERWTDAAARGWYSGENHIHANYGYGAWYNSPRTVLAQCEGEDLRVANVVVANSDGEAVFDREFFTGKPHPLSTDRHVLYWNQEFRSTSWGHMTLFNLSRLIEPIFTGFAGTTNPWDVPTNADIARRTAEQGGVASYTHPTNNLDVFLHAYSAKGLPVDVALGRIDAMDVMGGGYKTSLVPWYHVLNCGFRIPAAAGTDCFLNRVRSALPGWGRVYVHLPEGLDYGKWVAGVTSGRSFVSNGPMIELSLGETPVGGTLALDAPARVRVRARAAAQFPLQRLELVYNGEVVAAGVLAADELSAAIDQEVMLERSGWVACRVSGPAVQYWPGGERAAHTNPVYLEIGNHPMERVASAGYFLAWIDRLEALLWQRDRMHTGREHVAAQMEEAREVYRRMLWQDAAP